ncbi:MAG TPA: hypothetical protein VFV72_05395 [Candidatus Limnocylindrales bacterium]|nr:hypothetical protein [Candidatus Limnocylindrales bacterium]
MPDRVRRPGLRRFAALGFAAVLVLGSLGTVVARDVPTTGTRAAFLLGCPVLPATNVWNRRVDSLPVRADSATLISRMGLANHLHPDFGSYAGYGIPVNVVSAATPLTTVSFTWPSESDAGPYPIPASPKIEGNGAPGDRHILMLDTKACRLWELFAASKGTKGWSAGSGAIYDLRSNALRPDGWTSADAAGLPIYPGLARYDDVAAGVIAHALRFTVPETRNRHIYPARHHASSLTGASYPPMGLRLRLKSNVDISGFGPQSRVILRALKRYGMILADNGSAYYITGAPDPRWNDDDLHDLHQINGSMFEVVDTTGFVNGS